MPTLVLSHTNIDEVRCRHTSDPTHISTHSIELSGRVKSGDINTGEPEYRLGASQYKWLCLFATVSGGSIETRSLVIGPGTQTPSLTFPLEDNVISGECNLPQTLK